MDDPEEELKTVEKEAEDDLKRQQEMFSMTQTHRRMIQIHLILVINLITVRMMKRIPKRKMER